MIALMSLAQSDPPPALEGRRILAGGNTAGCLAENANRPGRGGGAPAPLLGCMHLSIKNPGVLLPANFRQPSGLKWPSA